MEMINAGLRLQSSYLGLGNPWQVSMEHARSETCLGPESQRVGVSCLNHARSGGARTGAQDT